MTEKKDVDYLYNLIENNIKVKRDIKKENLVYVIYVRKSTNEDGKQERSIDDQISECKAFAERNNLYYKKIIEERQSAKEPNIRPEFTKMLQDVKNGVYDGIIAWHPDRLSRNMKEAGEIIDMLDRKDILDLKFVFYTFTNDTSGKMALGITFVISKQYSDHLSDNVKRGNRLAIADGKYVNTSKHGYKKDREKRLRPDGEYYHLIRNAFQMRVDGNTLDEIANYLNKNNYKKYKVSSGKYEKFIWNKKKAGELLKDPFYTGVLVYNKSVVKLNDLYSFTPAVSVDDFLKINKALSIKDDKFKIKEVRSDKTKAKLLNGMVICNSCGEKMSAGITTKKNSDGSVKQRIFYYRCNTPTCDRYNKSTRARVVINFVKEFLNKKPFSNQEMYQRYYDEMNNILKERIKEKDRKLKSSLKTYDKQMKGIKKLLVSMNNGEKTKESQKLIDEFTNDYNVSSRNYKTTQKLITEMIDKINDEKSVIISYEKYLELWSNMAKNIGKITNMEQLDKVIKKIFSNFYVSGKKVLKNIA